MLVGGRRALVACLALASTVVLALPPHSGAVTPAEIEPALTAAQGGPHPIWARMTITTNPAVPQQEVRFDGSLSDGGHELFCRYPDIEAWEWDLDGDGSFETAGEAVTRTYDRIQTIRVSLRVTNGCTSDTETQDLVVGPAELAAAGSQVPGDLNEPATPAGPGDAGTGACDSTVTEEEIGCDDVAGDPDTVGGLGADPGIEAFIVPEGLAGPDSAARAPSIASCRITVSASVFLIPFFGWATTYTAVDRCTSTLPGIVLGADLRTPKGTTVSTAGTCLKTPGKVCRVRGVYLSDRRYSHYVDWTSSNVAPPGGVWVLGRTSPRGNCTGQGTQVLTCHGKTRVFR